MSFFPGGSEDATSASRPTAYSTAYAPAICCFQGFRLVLFLPGFQAIVSVGGLR